MNTRYGGRQCELKINQTSLKLLIVVASLKKL